MINKGLITTQVKLLAKFLTSGSKLTKKAVNSLVGHKNTNPPMIARGKISISTIK